MLVDSIRNVLTWKAGNLPLIRRLLVDYGIPNTYSYMAAFAMLAVGGACTGLTAYLVGSVVNQAYVSRDMGAIAGLTVVVMIVFTVKGFAMYGGAVLLERIGNRVVADIQRRMFDKLLISGVDYFSDRHSADFLNRATRGARAAAGVLKLMITALGRDIVTLICLVSVMVIQQPILSIVGLLIMPPAVAMIVKLVRRTNNIAGNEFQGVTRVYQMLQETIRGLRVVKAFTLEEEMRVRVSETIAGVERAQNKMARLKNRTGPLMETLGGLAIGAVLLYGGYSVLELGATPGQFVSFITAFLLAYEPAKRIAKLNVNLSILMIGTRRLFDVLDSKSFEQETDVPAEFSVEPGRIEFQSVRFAYRPKSPALRNVSFTAEPRRMTALVGPSGGGKSTIMSLLLRFYDPGGGTIEIDGRDITTAPRRALRRQIAYVGQDVFLFYGTIRENIAMGKLDASEEEIVAAAKAAFAHDFIAAFADGYDSMVGESGLKLSGGERQRIAIARALIRNAPIILLDEATSSLDSETERDIQAAIEKLREGRTCLVIAHRLHTITRADCIHVLEQGRVVESGTHAELLAHNGRYAEFIRLQSVQEHMASEPASEPEPETGPQPNQPARLPDAAAAGER